MRPRTIRLGRETCDHGLDRPLLVHVVEEALLEHSVWIYGRLFCLLLGLWGILLGFRRRRCLSGSMGLRLGLLRTFLSSFYDGQARVALAYGRERS